MHKINQLSSGLFYYINHALPLQFPERIDALPFAIVFLLHYIQLPCDSPIER